MQYVVYFTESGIVIDNHPRFPSLPPAQTSEVDQMEDVA